MSQKTFDRRAEEVFRILDRHPEGLSRDAIEEKLTEDVTTRTVQRLLTRMAEEGLLRVEGESRATLYFNAHVPISNELASSIRQVGLSRRAVRDIGSVSRPIASRSATGYEPSLLLDYSPNVTTYLSQEERESLWTAGRVFDEAQPAGTFARQLYDRMIVDLSWASSRLEGNTYSLLDTRILIETGHRAEGKDALEAQMILNHKAAIDLLLSDEQLLGYNRTTMLNLHAALASGLLSNPEDEGRLRRHGVGISGSTYTPLSIPQQIEEYFDLILSKASDIEDPFEQAFFFFLHIPYLQPFADVNKRVARMGCNHSFIKANLRPISFIGVPRDLLLMSFLSFYENRAINALKEVFLFAYLKSAERYTIIRDAMPSPDPMRLKYRALLTEALQDTVQGGLPIKRETVRTVIPETVVAEERDVFLDLLLEELLNLHEGNILRHRIRPSEFETWKRNTSRSSDSR